MALPRHPAAERSPLVPGRAPRPGAARSAGWSRWIPAALIALAAIPVVIAGIRLVQVLGGPVAIPADARFGASPAPVVVHIVASIGYALLGAFQFSAGIRRRHRGWHRRAGRVLVVLGLAVALSGLWMTLFYARKEGTGEVLYWFRLAAASGMGASVILGFAAIRRRDIIRHRAWMMRAYALALGAGTQAFTVGFGEAIFGSGVVRTDLMLGAGWAINLAVAEWVIRRSPRPRTGHGRGRWAEVAQVGRQGATAVGPP
jgi:uncharacterized membrane protein